MEKSLAHLKRHPKFGPLIKRHGPPELKRGMNHFEALCRSIVYQQLSGKAAETIYRRFRALFPKGSFPKPAAVAKIPHDKLRSVGLSNQKASYIHDLAVKFADGTVNTRRINSMTNDEIIEKLTQVKGIGVWTVHMFLIFTLNRLDVLPTGDLGVRKGFQVVYGLKTLPSPRTMKRLAKDWREHASIASWYLWKVADDK
jgi:DNA-3-methyladenine glycosylase II